jgi:hypothetical protein
VTLCIESENNLEFIMGIKRCNNCKQIIGNLEESFIDNNQIVCKSCNILLKGDSCHTKVPCSATNPKNVEIPTNILDNNDPPFQYISESKSTEKKILPERLSTDKQLLVTVFGGITSLLTGVILGLIEFYTGAAIYSYMYWFIIPLGALVFGMVAASGYYVGAKLFNQKPAGGVLFNMIGASVGVFFIVRLIPYSMFEVDSVPIREMISFWQYIDIDIRTTSISHFMSNASTGELGFVGGYIYAALQLLGFSVGGFLVFGNLSGNPYCDKCSCYLKITSQQGQFTNDSNIFVKLISNYSKFIDEHKLEDAIYAHKEHIDIESVEDYPLRTIIITRTCIGCGLNHLQFITSKHNGENWEDIPEAEISFFTETPLNLTKNIDDS